MLKMIPPMILRVFLGSRPTFFWMNCGDQRWSGLPAAPASRSSWWAKASSATFVRGWAYLQKYRLILAISNCVDICVCVYIYIYIHLNTFMNLYVIEHIWGLCCRYLYNNIYIYTFCLVRSGTAKFPRSPTESIRFFQKNSGRRGRSVRCISWQSKRKMPMSWQSDAAREL